MTSKIGNYIFENNFEEFTLSLQRNRKFYFDVILTVIKIILAFSVIILLDNTKKMDVFSYAVIVVFFAIIILYLLIKLYSIIGKPFNSFIRYKRKSKTITIKTNYFKTQIISINDGDKIIVERIVIEGDNVDNLESSLSFPDKYFFQISYSSINNEKYEMFIVNPSNILVKQEGKTLNELEYIAKSLVQKMTYVAGVDSEFVDLVRKKN